MHYYSKNVQFNNHRRKKKWDQYQVDHSDTLLDQFRVIYLWAQRAKGG